MQVDMDGGGFDAQHGAYLLGRKVGEHAKRQDLALPIRKTSTSRRTSESRSSDGDPQDPADCSRAVAASLPPQPPP